MEAARVWNHCMQTHKTARMGHAPWPGQRELEQATKGMFSLNAQAVQQIVHAFLANVATTRTLRREHPEIRMKYPWRTKRFYPVKWPAQAVHKEKERVVLPMGKGRPSLVLPLSLPEDAEACSLVWNRSFELHVSIELQEAESTPGCVQAWVKKTLRRSSFSRYAPTSTTKSAGVSIRLLSIVRTTESTIIGRNSSTRSSARAGLPYTELCK